MAILANTPVPTANGWVLASELRQGDIVFDSKGNPQEVKLIQEYTPQQCYRVNLDDGLSVTGDSKLTLHLETKKYRCRVSEYQNRPMTKFRKRFRRPLVTRRIEELLERGIRNTDGRLEYSIPTCAPVQFASRDLPVPPYVFGLWFASVTPTNKMWVRDKPLDKIKRIFRAQGFGIVTKRHKNGDLMFEIRPSIKDAFLFAGTTLPSTLPHSYCESGVEQRFDLLEGLIDGGMINLYSQSSQYVMREKNYHLIRKIQSLVESLGIKTILYDPDRYGAYSLKFRTNLFCKETAGKKNYFTRRFVKSVEEVPIKPCIHIESDAPILVGEGFISIC